MKYLIIALMALLFCCQGKQGETGPMGPQSKPDTVFVYDTTGKFISRVDTVFYYDTVFYETKIIIDTIFIDSLSSLVAFDSSGDVPTLQADTTISGSKYWLVRLPISIKPSAIKTISLCLQHSGSASWSCGSFFDYHQAANAISLQTSAKKFILHVIYSRQ